MFIGVLMTHEGPEPQIAEEIHLIGLLTVLKLILLFRGYKHARNDHSSILNTKYLNSLNTSK